MKLETRGRANHLTLVASCLEALDRREEALPGYKEAMEINRRVVPPGHPDALRTQIGMARTLVTLGRYGDAELLLLEAADHCERSDAAHRWHWGTVVEELVRLYESSGATDQAAEWRARTL
jgi:hypothetical protein